MRTHKNRSKIILAVIVAILATMISYSAFTNMNKQMQDQENLIKAMQAEQGKTNQSESYAYAVSTADLKAGELVSDQDVDFKNFTTEDKSAFENRSDVVNKVLLKDIAAGEAFTTSHIAKISSESDIALSPGYRALTLPADNFQGRSEKMVIGSVVDIYSTASDSSWILENVKILAFEKNSSVVSSTQSVPASIMNAASITFEVSTGQIPDFISSISKGKLMLVAKNPGDKKSVKVSTQKSYGGAIHHSAKTGHYSNYSALPNLPASVPISNFSGGSSSPGNLSGLPQPIAPNVKTTSVEVIEANVKSKVDFN